MDKHNRWVFVASNCNITPNFFDADQCPSRGQCKTTQFNLSKNNLSTSQTAINAKQISVYFENAQ